MHLTYFKLCLLVFSLVPHVFAQQPGTSPVQVYILAGQSNTVGQGEIEPATTIGTLEYIDTNDTSGNYDFISDGSGNLNTFEQAWIHYERSGNLLTGDLTTGFGAANDNIGPEFSFGYQIQTLISQQILIIKTAFGGRSLAVDFRPPSSGGTTGFEYNEIIRLVNDALNNIDTYFPDYDAAGGYEIAGFCWHQGFNDHINASFTAEYESNIANFIRDIRTDLGSPFPFVIATSGMTSGGLTTYSGVEQAQLAIADTTTYPEFDGNVAVIDTKNLWRDPVNSPVPNGSQGFHWNRHAGTYLDIGLAMANTIDSLDSADCPSNLRASGGANGVTLTWLNGTELPTSARVLRNGVEITASTPANIGSFLDTTAGPGSFDYEVQFTMPGDPCPALTTSVDTCIENLTAEYTPSGVTLDWTNQLTYAGIEIRRDGVLLEASFSGSADTYLDASAPTSGISTYSVQPTNGSCPTATATVNLNRPSITGTTLFADTFNRADINVTTGQTGELGPFNYTTRTFGNTTLDLNSNSLRINGPAGSGTLGGLVYINDHNFSDFAIANNGGFSISIDLASYSTVGSGRYMAIAVGQSLANLDSQSGVDPTNFAADLFVGFRQITGALEIFKNGTLDASETVTTNLPSAPTTMRIEYSLSDFVAGSPVSYNVFFDDADTAFASGTFNWSNNNENYISISSNLSNDARFDNLEIIGGEPVIDTEAPTPNPMTWSTPPTATSGTTIAMTASTASDPSGIEYFFTETSGNGNDSGWQSSPTFVANNLSPSTSYTYTVKARDLSANQNETSDSPALSATTSSTISSVLFADSFDRPNTSDLNDSNLGQSGSLGFLNYTTRTFNNVTLDINNNTLRINGPAASGSFGGLVFIDDHNFVDDDIASGGGFSVGVDIAAYSTAGSGRYMGLGVGQSLTELNSQAGVAPTDHVSDLYIGYRNTTDSLEVYKSGVLDNTESVTSGLPDAPTTMRIDYSFSDFDAGSSVNYNVFFDEASTPFTSGTFTWSGTNENYLSLASNLSNDSLFDNLEISGQISIPASDYSSWAAAYPTSDLSDSQADFDGDGFINDEERIWGLNPTDPSSASPYTRLLDSSNTFSYTRRDPSLTNLTYTVWTSSDLNIWTRDLNASSISSSPDINNVETLDVTLSATPVDGKLFVRIEVTE